MVRSSGIAWRTGSVVAALMLVAGCPASEDPPPENPGAEAAAGNLPTPEPERPPSVVLITVDTLRADRLGAYGYPRRTSPHFDAFAAEALLFENCLSHAPMTIPSFSAILTGFLPHETRVPERMPLPAEVDTLAELLRRAGYTTLAVVSNYALRARDWPDGMGWTQGFDVYDDEMTGRELVRDFPERTAPHTTNRALELLRRSRTGPVFLWVHYQDPHGPYAPPRQFAESVARPPTEERLIRVNPSESGVGGIPHHQRLSHNRNWFHYVWKYDGEIRYFDHEFGRLVSGLAEMGLYDTAFILFTADHGEGMGEHNLYFSHIGQLYRTLTHVPLVLRHGDRFVGRRSDYVQHLDIVATIAAVAGISADPRLRGRDLRLPPVAGREIFASAAESPVERDGGRATLVVDGVKLHKNLKTGRTELFDLRTDPGEEHDLSGDPDRRADVERLAARLEAIRSEDRLRIRGGEAEVFTREEVEKLRALGYVQ